MATKKRILVVTVSAWNSICGANTWASLLEKYDNAMIANICIRNEIPDSSVCSRYFAISENKVIKSIFYRRTKTGQEIMRKNADKKDLLEDLAQHNARYKKLGKKRNYVLLMVREIVWKLGKWKTKELDAFIGDFKPDVVMHSMEGYIHLNEITKYIIERTGAKAIGYIWDDNFTYKQSDKMGYRLYRFFQRRSLKKLANLTDVFFAISDITKREADSFFGINCQVLTKPLNSVPVVTYDAVNKPIHMLYTGNLYIGRDKSLFKTIQAIKHLPENTFHIDVYTNTQLDEDYLAQIDPKICSIHNAIAQERVLELQKKADVLLFLEDIDGPDALTARLSFSTKLTDYLSSGRCIFAVGNKDTAPMQYLHQHDAAITACSQDEILSALREVADCPKLLVDYAQKAAETGMKYHSKEIIRKTFDEALELL